MLLPRPRFRTAIVWALLGCTAERHRRPVQTSQAGPASQQDQLLTRGVREPPQDVHRDAIHRTVYGAADLLGLGISLERIRGRLQSRLSSRKLRLVRLLRTGDYTLAVHWPGVIAFASAAVFNPRSAYRIGRLKIRMARTVNSALASSTAPQRGSLHHRGRHPEGRRPLGLEYRPKGLGYSSNSDRRRMMRSGIGESGGGPTP
jgi:hypothetical protein